MSIEVRQLVIKSQVGAPAAPAARPGVSARELAQVKAQILAECRTWLRERLQQAKDR